MFDHAVADSRQFFELFRLLGELLDGFRQAIDKFGGLFVAAIPPNNRAINFQQLRCFAQYSCNLFVVHREGIISPNRGGNEVKEVDEVKEVKEQNLRVAASLHCFTDKYRMGFSFTS